VIKQLVLIICSDIDDEHLRKLSEFNETYVTSAWPVVKLLLGLCESSFFTVLVLCLVRYRVLEYSTDTWSSY